MKKNLILAMTTATVILSGCSKNNDIPADNWNGEIRLSSGVTVLQTRAADQTGDTQIANGQSVGVFINDGTTDNDISINLKYTADGNGNLDLAVTSPVQEIPYYPASGNAVKIIAYQPYIQYADIKETPYHYFSVANDQSGSNYYSSDLLYSESKSYNRQSAAQSLSFKHKLSKVVCTLTSGVGTPSLTDATVEIVGAMLDGSFNTSDGNFKTSIPGGLGVQGNIKMNSSIIPNSYIAILPPQTFNKDAKFLKVKLGTKAGGSEFYYKIPDGALVLDASKVYKYNITVNLSGVTISSSITDWTAVGAKNGNAEMI